MENAIPARRALRLQEQAQRKRVFAPSYDPVRQNMDIAEAQDLEGQASALLVPPEPLKTGLGDEIIPPAGLGMSGLEMALSEPSMLDLAGTVQRSELAEAAGVFELAHETAGSAKVKGSVQKMIAHQIAAAHKYSMEFLSEATAQKDPMIKCKLVNSATRLMEVSAKAALTLQRLQVGANQIVQVQHINVNGPAIVSQGGAKNAK